MKMYGSWKGFKMVFFLKTLSWLTAFTIERLLKSKQVQEDAVLLVKG